MLLAEDDPGLREILTEGLTEEGFVVVSAESGAHAVERYGEDGPYDALLLDEEMPGLTGREFLRRLRGSGDHIPALIISGNLYLEEAEQRELEVGPVLRKPIALADLAQALFTLLRK